MWINLLIDLDVPGSLTWDWKCRLTAICNRMASTILRGM